MLMKKISLILALILAGLAYAQIKHTHPRAREHRSSKVGLRKDSTAESSFDMRRA